MMTTRRMKIRTTRASTETATPFPATRIVTYYSSRDYGIQQDSTLPKQRRGQSCGTNWSTLPKQRRGQSHRVADLSVTRRCQTQRNPASHIAFSGTTGLGSSLQLLPRALPNSRGCGRRRQSNPSTARRAAYQRAATRMTSSSKF